MGYRAYQNNIEIKNSCISSIKQLLKNKKLTHETPWDVNAYAAAVCMPLPLANFIRHLFTHLPERDAQKWAVKHLETIHVGSDLSDIWPLFVNWLIDDEITGLNSNKKIGTLLDDLSETYRSKINNPFPNILQQVESHILKLTADNDPANSELYLLSIIRGLATANSNPEGAILQVISNIESFFESVDESDNKAETKHYSDDYEEYYNDLPSSEEVGTNKNAQKLFQKMAAKLTVLLKNAPSIDHPS